MEASMSFDSTVQDAPASNPVNHSKEPLTQMRGETRKEFRNRLARLNKGKVRPEPLTARTVEMLTGRKTKSILQRKKLARRAVIREAKGGKGQPRIDGETCARALDAAIVGGNDANSV
jgi:hypothetical protein